MDGLSATRQMRRDVKANGLPPTVIIILTAVLLVDA